MSDNDVAAETGMPIWFERAPTPYSILPTPALDTISGRELCGVHEHYPHR